MISITNDRTTPSRISMQTIADTHVMQKSPVFEGINALIVQNIVSVMHHESWPKGYHFKNPDQIPHYFYLVLKGRLKVGRYCEKSGRELTLFLLGPGDEFDILSLIDGDPLDQDLRVCALDKVELLSAPIAQWFDWFEEYPPLREAAARIALLRMSQLRDLASELAFNDTKTRLVHLLLRYFDSSSYGLRLIDDLSQEELANMIGSVRPVVARLLGELRREGAVDTHGGRLHVADFEKLSELADKHLGVSPFS